VRRSFIKVNNELVLSSGIQCEPRQLLVLLPHCIQSSRCTHRLTYHIDNCARCGACPLKDVLNLRDTYGVQVAIATGGNHRPPHRRAGPPKLIVAVACERDLSSAFRIRTHRRVRRRYYTNDRPTAARYTLTTRRDATTDLRVYSLRDRS